MSMSSVLRPAFSKAVGIANAGPMPIKLGSTPTTEKDRMRARMGRPSFSAAARLASSTKAAPSDTWLALPAVVLPPALNTAFSLPRPSSVVPARGPSSAFTTTSETLPFASFTLAVTGTISSSKSPAFCAAIAFAWDSTAIVSCTSRERFHFSATFSEVIPIGIRQDDAISLSTIFGDSFPTSTAAVMEYCVMDSTPPAMPMSMIPALML
mmetsp:Transcript_77938/g.142662  ORF Transcript_77938/g.142662 Transcript_77938/m.142662 type:complete len:210 (+) Transcript_77938:336-965(+)